MMMERRIDDVRSGQGLEWEVDRFDLMAGSMTEKSLGDYVKFTDYAEQASTIAALKEQLAGARNAALEEALDECGEVEASADNNSEQGEGVGAYRCVKAIRALASQPAAQVAVALPAIHEKPVYSSIDHDAFWFLIAKLRRADQGTDYRQASAAVVAYVDGWAAKLVAPQALPAAPVQTDELEGMTYERDVLASAIRDAAVKAGIANADAALTGPHLIMLCDDMVDCIKAAPPVQQPDDVRDLPNLPYTAKRWGQSQIQVWSEDAVRQAQREALATTRPGAALTDERIIEICDKEGLGPCLGLAVGRAILAASGGAEPVVPEGWQPIETAPEDCTIDILMPNGARWAEAYYDRICNEWRRITETGHIIRVKRDYPTHWHAIPAAPATQSQQGEGSGE